jgi:hypothetical protein
MQPKAKETNEKVELTDELRIQNPDEPFKAR